MFELKADTGIQQDGDDVESGRRVVQAVFGQPGKGSLADLPLLEGGNGQLGKSIGQVAAGLHLYKNKAAAVAGDDIHLTPLAAEVAFQYLQSGSDQVSCRQFLPPVA